MVGRRVKQALEKASRSRVRKDESHQNTGPYDPRQPKRCGHAECLLTDREKCCSCSDTRRDRYHNGGINGFMHYVDGSGWQDGAHRAEYYCPACRVKLHPGITAYIPYKRCGHHLCELLTFEACCVCMDKRPISDDGYTHYVPGCGWLPGGSRSANYCGACHSRTPSSSSSTPAPIHLAPPSHSHRFTASSTSFTPPPIPKKSNRIRSPAHSPVPTHANLKDCGHDQCSLLIPLCCTCADKRPHENAYPQYVDGVGHTLTGERWSMYCYACQQLYQQSTRNATQQSSPTLVPATQSPLPYLLSPILNLSAINLSTLDQHYGVSPSSRVPLSTEDEEDDWTRASAVSVSDWNSLDDSEGWSVVSEG